MDSIGICKKESDTLLTLLLLVDVVFYIIDEKWYIIESSISYSFLLKLVCGGGYKDIIDDDNQTLCRMPYGGDGRDGDGDGGTLRMAVVVVT